MSFRVVIDPNVLVSASLVAEGPSGQIINAWHNGRFELVVCPLLLEELEDVLARKRIAARVTSRERTAFLQLLSDEASNVNDPEIIQGLTGDPDDDYLASLVLASNATYLVTGDAKLSSWKPDNSVVLTPRAFLDLIEAEAASE